MGTSTEVDGDYVREITETWLHGQIEEVEESEDLTEEEKESLIRDLEYIYKREYEGRHDDIAEEAGDRLEANVIKYKFIEFMAVLIDSALVLTPTILAYNGYVTRSLIFFAMISYMSASTIKDVAKQKGITSNLDIVLGILISITLTYLPYIVVLILLWLG